MNSVYEIRDPVHGFIKINTWEREIINSSAFQRLRRIRQLAWTDMVYPGATHSRFEHSLGVMHVASCIFDSLAEKQKDLLQELGYGTSARPRQLIRLAALLHDIGHAPFSHAAEELFPINVNTKKHYVHEEYTAAIIEFELKDIIENHHSNRGIGIRVKDLTDFFRETPSRAGLVLRNLVAGQMDADRMDYMLRDSHHAGVSYGKYDLQRLIATIKFVKKPESEGEYVLGIPEDGKHAAEGLIIARYMMFTQVYFHKTRTIYDYHLAQAIKAILIEERDGFFPPPTTEMNIREYLDWDDWHVFGKLKNLKGEHAEALRERKHYRLLDETPEIPQPSDLDWIEQLQQKLENAKIPVVKREPSKSWYKFDPGEEIYVEIDMGGEGNKVVPLSERSSVVKGLWPIMQRRLYVPEGRRKEAEEVIKKMREK